MLKLKIADDDEQLRQNFRSIEAADRNNYKKNQDVELGGNRLILTAPNGSRYKVSVSNAGALTVTLI